MEVREAAARGWRLIPIKARDKKPPLLKHWPAKASCDLNRLGVWATQFPSCNWGLATGQGSNVFVLDVDGEAGNVALHAYRQEGHELPSTLSISTGRGRQLYFCYPKGQRIPNSAGKLAIGLDIRGEGGYAVIPPSVHPNGRQYAFVDPKEPIAAAPEWLVQKIERRGAAATRMPSFDILTEGYRNDGLFRYACALRRRGAILQELETDLLLTNVRRCRPPLPEDEVLRIAASAAAYPVGGPDPLEYAWAAVLGQTHLRGYEKFLALARNLQQARPGIPIALPLERIGALMGCDWTQARRWRQRAVREGCLLPAGKYVPHRKAALYILTECTTRGFQESVPLGPSAPLPSSTSGLVGHLQVFSSGTSVNRTENGYLEGWL